MASVLAIISKAVFEKEHGRAAKVGDVLAIDRYNSSPTAFAQLGKGDALFLVTVRPPDESLWLVAVLESPKQQGKAWTAKPNMTPIRNITPLAKQLRFATGTGIKAKSGALAMSLQTPRVLTVEDVALLRGSAGKLALTNIRKPFASLKKLPKPQYAQLALLTANNDAGTPEQCVKDAEWSTMQLADVTVGSDVLYQLYVWGAGSGALFEAEDTDLLATMSQHAFALTGDDNPTLRRELASACEASPAFASIDFSRVKPKQAAAEKLERDVQQAAMERLEKALGESKERYRLFEALTAKQQAAIREAYAQLDPYEHFRRFERLGIPPRGALARWAGIEPAGPLEQRAGQWPVWKWLKAALEGEIDNAAAVRALAKIDASDLAWLICLRDVDANDYEFWPREKNTLRENVDGCANTVRLLAALIDAADVAVPFAKRVQREIAKETQYALGAVALFALAARARRRDEMIDKQFFNLGLELERMGPYRELGSHVREVFEAIAAEEREAFFDEYGMYFVAIEEDEIRNGRSVEVPTLKRGWLVADLVPTKKVAAKMIEDVATWDHYPKPKAAALDVIKKVGPICVPFLEKAAKTSNSKHKAVLGQALKMFTKRDAQPSR